MAGLQGKVKSAGYPQDVEVTMDSVTEDLPAMTFGSFNVAQTLTSNANYYNAAALMNN